MSDQFVEEALRTRRLTGEERPVRLVAQVSARGVPVAATQLVVVPVATKECSRTVVPLPFVVTFSQRKTVPLGLEMVRAVA